MDTKALWWRCLLLECRVVNVVLLDPTWIPVNDALDAGEVANLSHLA
jgi:hypothetical protein